MERPGGPLPAPGPALMLVRPEALRLLGRRAGALAGTVMERRFTGPPACSPS